FRSGPGDVGPAFYEPEGFKWGRGWFGGLVTSCGLDFVGHPEVDPEEENAEMPLHGRLSYIPAKNVGIEAGWEGSDYVVRIRGQMRQAEVFAENLELSREISTVLGERSIHIRDRIENLAADRSPLMFVLPPPRRRNAPRPPQPREHRVDRRPPRRPRGLHRGQRAATARPRRCVRASAPHRPPRARPRRPAQRQARLGIILAVQAQRDPHRQPLAALPQGHLRHRH
ncbi:MAG: DUF4432 family protein, partial [Candidatus Latescibacteria bacterium]|nr:DUF4432 family protein [Candidatus Latescibacterota bacterium]